MTKWTTVFAGAALAVAASVGGAAAQSNAWSVSGGLTAASCIPGSEPRVCAVVTCQSGAPLLSITGVAVGDDQTLTGRVRVDDWSRPANFVRDRLGGAQNFRGATAWTIVPREPHRFIERIRLGGQLTVDLGLPGGPLTFGLRGSGRSVGSVERRCPA